jgi:hypothetical protein
LQAVGPNNTVLLEPHDLDTTSPTHVVFGELPKTSIGKMRNTCCANACGRAWTRACSDALEPQRVSDQSRLGDHRVLPRL